MACATFVSCVAAMPGSAQDIGSAATASDVAKHVAIDPTTYAPAVAYFVSARLDWSSSQPFFRQGITEHNPDFTVSGRADDAPISYAAGNRRIVAAALGTAGLSVANNVTEGLFERALNRRDPDHRKLWHALGWIERIGFASYLGYQESVLHIQQWQVNRQLAAERGYH